MKPSLCAERVSGAPCIKIPAQVERKGGKIRSVSPHCIIKQPHCLTAPLNRPLNLFAMKKMLPKPLPLLSNINAVLQLHVAKQRVKPGCSHTGLRRGWYVLLSGSSVKQEVNTSSGNTALL